MPACAGMTACLAVCLIVFTAPALAATADAHLCDAYPDIPVTVVTRFDAPAYDYDTTIEDLQKLARDSKHTIHESLTLGLTRYEPFVEIRAPLKGVRFPNGVACARVDHLEVMIGYRDVKVYVAREIKPHSCGFDQVMAHEQKHIAVNRQILEKYKPMIEHDFHNYLRLNGMFREQNPQYAFDLVQQKLKGMLGELSDKMGEENAERQQEVDSKEEYRRVSLSCGGELQGVVRQFMIQERR
jgi:hypothetical protein